MEPAGGIRRVADPLVGLLYNYLIGRVYLLIVILQLFLQTLITHNFLVLFVSL